jgi:hypothetical protein
VVDIANRVVIRKGKCSFKKERIFFFFQTQLETSETVHLYLGLEKKEKIISNSFKRVHQIK